MFAKATRCTFLGEAGPDPLVAMSLKVRRSYAEHQVACLLRSSPGSIGFDREVCWRRRLGSELPVSISLSRDTRGVLVDHGGG